MTVSKSIQLECHRCTACCRWPGEVRLEADEIAKIAALKNMAETDFIERHMRLRKDRRGLALRENPDGSCIFLEGNACAIQAAKPEQCKEFPNRWVNQLWGKMPLAEMRRDYPMLFNCDTFKAFLKANGR
jgi:Fe-S-cluster containining protein